MTESCMVGTTAAVGLDDGLGLRVRTVGGAEATSPCLDAISVARRLALLSGSGPVGGTEGCLRA